MSKTDYDLTKIKGVVFDVDGVLSPACVSLDENGIPRRMANLRDGYAIYHGLRSGLKIAIITGGNDPSIEARYRGLGMEDVFMVTGPKKPYLEKWMEKHGLMPFEVAYVGDDIPDYECMQAVGLSVAPADAAPEIHSVAYYITHATGGNGVARELIEQIMKAQNTWPISAAAFGK